MYACMHACMHECVSTRAFSHACMRACVHVCMREREHLCTYLRHATLRYTMLCYAGILYERIPPNAMSARVSAYVYHAIRINMYRHTHKRCTYNSYIYIYIYTHTHIHIYVACNTSVDNNTPIEQDQHGGSSAFNRSIGVHATATGEKTTWQTQKCHCQTMRPDWKLVIVSVFIFVSSKQPI